MSQVEELAAQLPACFADRLGIGRVVLVSLHEGLHIDRRVLLQTSLLPELGYD